VKLSKWTWECLSWNKSSKNIKTSQLWFYKIMGHDLNKSLESSSNKIKTLYVMNVQKNVSWIWIKAQNHFKTKSNCFVCCICYQTRNGIRINNIINCYWAISKMVENMFLMLCWHSLVVVDCEWIQIIVCS
jgi:hypothetical protein